MSENLKRAESLFNRIMNPGAHDSSSSLHSQVSAGSPITATSESPISLSSTTILPGTASTSNAIPRKYTVPSKIPKLDVEKLTQEALATVPSTHHTLPYCWTIWYHSRTKKKDPVVKPEESEGVSVEEQQNNPGVDLYLQTTSELSFVDSTTGAKIQHIASLEQMWSSISSLKITFDLNIGTEFLIFKTGVNPVWEDPINSKGGRWVFRFNRKLMNDDDLHKQEALRKRTSLIWERLVLKTVTGSLIPDSNSEEIQELLLNDISGLVLSLRKDEDIISLWNSNLNFFGKKETKKLTSFQARRILCDSILRVIRECDLITQGSDCVETIDTGSNERVFGVSFEYRIHADNEREREKVGITSTSGTTGNGTNGYHYGGHKRYSKFSGSSSIRTE
ncbi:Eukaryotic translation initiation factor 4E-4 [Candida viswanathii]|uniref:Eukaryotic translation initiation factor 4E-4 n=1 Tax=Candida viswanathii TaxID=5486 RepID=A0A367YHA2_9ASCO|nr:Eukaryotic translation initiation factor 4E-4 [Candida viswanathii]